MALHISSSYTSSLFYVDFYCLSVRFSYDVDAFPQSLSADAVNAGHICHLRLLDLAQGSGAVEREAQGVHSEIWRHEICAERQQRIVCDRVGHTFE